MIVVRSITPVLSAVSLVLQLFCVLSNTSSSFAEDKGEDWQRRFESEARKQWQEYEARTADLHGTYVWKTTLLSNNSVLRETHFELKEGRQGGWIITDRIRGYGTTSGDLAGYNSRYTFHLARREPSAPWVIRDVDLERQELAEIEVRVRLKTAYGLAIFGRHNYLPRMAEEPGFRVDRVEPVLRDGKTLALAHFTRTVKDRNVGPVVRGQLLLDPNRYWLLVEFDVVQEFIDDKGKITPNKMTGLIEYSQTADGFPVVRRHPLRAEIYTPGLGPVEELHEFSLERVKSDEQDFTLTAFGLPEPPGVDWKRPTPWWIWLAAAGVACILLGGAFYWLRARASRA